MPELNAEHVDAVRAVKRTCKGPRVTDANGHPVGDLRQGCGADVNDLILGNPLDGCEHAAECPNCGAPISWRAPRFED
jgi:hypothetical protein